jgi:poly(ADP-ribose) glycohydrolase ARH3
MLRSGAAWDEAPRHLFDGKGSYGNGAAMRVAPVALFAVDDLEKVASLARQTASVTHTHELGVEGAVLQACAIASLLHHSPDVGFDTVEFVETLYGLVGSQHYCQRLDGILAIQGRAWEDVEPSFGTGLNALDSVPTALCAFLWHQDDFTGAIAMGGDTDTIAAMAGSLSGAYLGASAIPSHLRESVEGSVALTRVANDLLDRTARRADEGTVFSTIDPQAGPGSLSA